MAIAFDTAMIFVWVLVFVRAIGDTDNWKRSKFEFSVVLYGITIAAQAIPIVVIWWWGFAYGGRVWIPRILGFLFQVVAVLVISVQVHFLNGLVLVGYILCWTVFSAWLYRLQKRTATATTPSPSSLRWWPYSEENYDRFLIHACSETGDEAIVRQLLSENLMRPSEIHMMEACRRGHLPVLRRLLESESGASAPSLSREDIVGLVRSAADGGHTPVLCYLWNRFSAVFALTATRQEFVEVVLVENGVAFPDMARYFLNNLTLDSVPWPDLGDLQDRALRANRLDLALDIVENYRRRGVVMPVTTRSMGDLMRAAVHREQWDIIAHYILPRLTRADEISVALELLANSDRADMVQFLLSKYRPNHTRPRLRVKLAECTNESHRLVFRRALKVGDVCVVCPTREWRTFRNWEVRKRLVLWRRVASRYQKLQ